MKSSYTHFHCVNTLIVVGMFATLFHFGITPHISFADTTIPVSYYVDPSGSDSNDGTTPDTALASIDKVNTLSLHPGDKVLFKRGASFYGTLQITASGTSDQPIIIDGYGSGNNPVISGFTTLTGWKDDGAGIYTWNGSDGSPVNQDRQIIGNIISHGVGSFNGLDAGSNPGYAPSQGIYIDDGASNVTISGNTVMNNHGAGIFLHDITQNIIVDHNTLINNNQEIYYVPYIKTPDHPNVIINNNILASTSAGEVLANFQGIANDPSSFFGTVNNNYYVHAGDESFVYANQAKGVVTNFATWQSTFGQDATSKEFTTTPRFEYNASGNPKNISLDGSYKDVFGAVSTNNITLAPYSSVVLFKATIPPVTIASTSTITPTTVTPPPIVSILPVTQTPATTLSKILTALTPIPKSTIQTVPLPITNSSIATNPVTDIVAALTPHISEPTGPLFSEPVPSNSKKDYSLIERDDVLNGTLVHTTTTFPDTWQLDTSTLANGTYTLTTTFKYADGTSDTANSSFTIGTPPTVFDKIIGYIKTLLNR